MSTRYKSYRQLENLHKHKALTPTVKERLRQHRERLEEQLTIIKVLLEKPTKRDKTDIFGEKL